MPVVEYLGPLEDKTEAGVEYLGPLEDAPAPVSHDTPISRAPINESGISSYFADSFLQSLDPKKTSKTIAYSTILNQNPSSIYDLTDYLDKQIDVKKKEGFFGVSGEWTPEEDPGTELMNSIKAGGYGTVENYLRAGRVLGLDTDNKLDAIKKTSDDYQQTRFGGIWPDVTSGVRSTIESVLGGVPGMAVGFIGGRNPVSTILGFAAGAGGLFTLAEYDRFMEEAEQVATSQGLPFNREDYKSEAVISALAEGGIEAITDIVGARIFGLIGNPSIKPAVKATLLKTFGKFLGNTLKLGAIEVPGEMITAAIQSQARQEAGIPTQDAWEAAKSVIGPSVVQTLLMGGIGAGVDIATRKSIHEGNDITDKGGQDVEVNVRVGDDIIPLDDYMETIPEITEPTVQPSISDTDLDAIMRGEKDIDLETGDIVDVEATETKPTKVSQDIKAKALETDILDSFQDIAQYTPVTVKEQVAKATKLLTDDIEKAKRIVRGQETLPDGILGGTMIKVMEDYATQNNDVTLLMDLARSPLTAETSVHAQEMRMLAERNPDSPLSAIQDIAKTREKMVKERFKVKDVKKAVKEDVKSMKSEIKKVAKKKETWNDLVDLIKKMECK